MSLLSDNIAKANVDIPLFHSMVHGDASTVVTTESGSVPSVSKTLNDLAGGRAKGAWATTTIYALNDLVSNSGSVYRCTAAHTSSATLATDLGLGRWVDQTPGLIANARLATVATQTFKGRVSAGTGTPEDLTAAQASALMTGLANAQQANMSNGTIKGRVTSGAGAPEDLTAAQAAGLLSPLIGPGLVNRIINGDMRIDQRNNGASVTIPAVVTTYVLDRFAYYCQQASKISVQRQTATPFSGFTHYQRVTSLSAYTPLTGDTFSCQHSIEGYNVSDLMWGTASAKPITLFIRVRSSLTGTFSGSIKNGAGTRAYPFTFSIPVANTETLIAVNVPGDTAGTWNTDNTSGLQVSLDLGSGSTYRATAGAWGAGNITGATGAVNLVATNGATFDFTGVELYPGTLTNPPGAWRPYAIEEMLCKRYLPAINATSAAHLLGHGQCVSASAIYMEIALTVKPRVPPTGMSVFSGAQFNIYQANGTGTATTGCAFGGASNDYAQIVISGASGLVAGNVSTIYINTSSGYILFTGCEI